MYSIPRGKKRGPIRGSPLLGPLNAVPYRVPLHMVTSIWSRAGGQDCLVHSTYCPPGRPLHGFSSSLFPPWNPQEVAPKRFPLQGVPYKGSPKCCPLYEVPSGFSLRGPLVSFTSRAITVWSLLGVPSMAPPQVTPTRGPFIVSHTLCPPHGVPSRDSNS